MNVLASALISTGEVSGIEQSRRERREGTHELRTFATCPSSLDSLELVIVQLESSRELLS